MDEERKKLILQNKEAFDQDFKTLKEVIEKHEAVRENTTRYIYQVITAIGVVAGFGFTAISFVKIIYLFILGESLLFVAMAIGIRFIKKAFIDDAAVYADVIDKLGKVMEERLEIPNNPTGEIQSLLEKMTTKELAIFEVKPRNIKSDFILSSIFYAFIFGAAFLLLSFLSFYFW